MSTAKKFHVGQEVMTATYGHTPKPATVTKVGRLYVTAGRDDFRVDTGALKSGYNGRIYTLDEWAKQDEHRDLRARARARGVQSIDDRVPVDQLRRIVAILEEDCPDCLAGRQILATAPQEDT